MRYFRKKYNDFILTDYLKDISTLVSGSLIAQLITFLSIPLLSRLYTPEDFGAYSTFITLTGIFGLISNLLYDRAIILPKKDSNALSLFIAAVFFSFLTLIFILTTIVLFRPLLSDYFVGISTLIFFLIPLRVFQLGIFQASEQISIRDKKFKSTAIIRSSNSFLTSLFQISSNIFYNLNGGLILGKILSDIIATILFIISNISFFLKNIPKVSLASVASIVKKHIVFPKFQLPSIFSNTVSQSLPIVFLTSFFSLEIAGFYGMSMRLLKQPTELIGSSTQNVFYQRATGLFNKGESILGLFTSTTLNLTKIYILPMFIIIFFAPLIFELFLGSEWVVAGQISQILIFWCFFSFIKPPAMMLFNILKLQHIQLRIEFTQLFLRIAALLTGYIFFQSYLVSITLFVIVSATVDIYTLFFIYNSVLKNETESSLQKNKKIVFIISGLGQGGAERVLSIVANECVDRGFDVEIISGYNHNSAYKLNDKIKIHYLGFKRLNIKNIFKVFIPIVSRLLKITSVLNHSNPDLIISFGDATNVQAIVSNKFLRFNSAKQIISIRSNPEKLHIFSMFAVNIFYRFSDQLIVQTSFVKNWAKQRFSKLNVKIINNPVKFPKNQDVEKNIDFLHVGTIKFEKNHIDLIKAFNIFSKKIDNSSKLYLVGGVESHSLLTKIKDLVRLYNIEHRVIFAGSQENIDSFYKKSKIFVLPSLYEGMSNALLEAMSHGIPSITTAYKGSSDVIKNGFNGIIVPQKDIKSLAKAMHDLYVDKNKRIFLGGNAKKTIQENFKKEKVMKNWLKSIYDELREV